MLAVHTDADSEAETVRRFGAHGIRLHVGSPCDVHDSIPCPVHAMDAHPQGLSYPVIQLSDAPAEQGDEGAPLSSTPAFVRHGGCAGEVLAWLTGDARNGECHMSFACSADCCKATNRLLCDTESKHALCCTSSLQPHSAACAHHIAGRRQPANQGLGCVDVETVHLYEGK